MSKKVKWTLDSFVLLSAFLQSTPNEWIFSKDRLEAVRKGGSRVVVNQDWLVGDPLLCYYHGGTRITLHTTDEDEMIVQL